MGNGVYLHNYELRTGLTRISHDTADSSSLYYIAMKRVTTIYNYLS